MTIRPPMTPASAAPPLDGLVDLLRGGVVVLSGAGISTDSGIPDYRGPTGIARGATPMTYQEFIGSVQAQQRYWARSFAGWPRIRRSRPNPAHAAVTRLQRLGAVTGVITQNVDGLHQAAGSRDVVELHGALDRVVCLACGGLSDRASVQDRLAAANPDLDLGLDPGPAGAAAGLLAPDGETVRPDGDVVLAESAVARFRPVDCTGCGGGPLKPDVVFFGESVPRGRVARCFDLVDDARALLVLGSSLSVMSGYRFVRRAARLGLAIAIVNAGPTRGDGEATLRLDAPLGLVLPEVVAALERGRSPAAVHVSP